MAKQLANEQQAQAIHQQETTGALKKETADQSLCDLSKKHRSKEKLTPYWP
jgi:hypothetical protein